MRNALVLGSGRSGTSMLAGTLARAGWFVGEKPYTPRASNPKGFFESPEINGINEYLLAQVLPASDRSGEWQRWLASLEPGVECRTDARAEERIRAAVARAPWCFKDPRLCYTLPVWRPHLRDAVYLCVFRDPAVTVRSILKECRDEEYLHSLAIDREEALEVWLRLYRRVLDQHQREGEWLFLDYEQVLTADGLARVERLVGAPISRDFPDRVLRRTQSDEAVPSEVARTYAELCERAGFAAPHTKTHVAAPRSAPSTPLERVLTTVAAQNGWLEIPADLQALATLQRKETRAAAEDLLRGARDASSAPSWILQAHREDCEDYVVQRLPRIPVWQRLVAQLSVVDIDALARIGQVDAAAAILATLHETVGELLAVEAREELVRVLDERGATQLSDVLDSLPWPIATSARRRVLAWPSWAPAGLDELWLTFGRALSARPGTALCLRFDPSLDGRWNEAEKRLAESYERALPDQPPLEVVVLNEPIPDQALPRLGLAAHCALSLSEHDARRAAWVEALQLPLAHDAAQLDQHLNQARAKA